ncbi:leucine-rich repeat flightless-interacting protein 2-like [Tachysurus fulvidraco]|uniref:leucine-rich repeat flightless-interacting protein 2-like n=1 Tax=Tachysurus fulvidraco TaxID=1234273 RepID=UPI000F4E065F|nr:leucine-rich repeat flightless-interacting protein 2-like [Tachysurus fulvidraco]
MFGSVNHQAADLPTRLLLSAAGIAVDVYCYFICKRRFWRKKAVTDGQFQTSVFPSTEAPSICCRPPQLEERVRELEGLLRMAQENEAKSLVSLADAELKHNDTLYSISQLEEEKSELKNQVDKLRSTVQELGEELCQCHLENEELQKECEQNKEAHKALQLEHEKLKQELFLKEVVLKVSLADAELKHNDTLYSISQLKEEKSELKDQVDKLRSTVQELGEELCQCHLENEELLKKR